jgi:hypothetical protein
MAAAKKKALGEDLLGAELDKIGAEEIAGSLRPLTTKIYENAWVSSQLRGTHLFACPKPGGQHGLAKGYKDVVIAELNAKVLGSQIRDQSIGAVREIALETQYGSGLNGGSIQTAHLHLRAYADHAQLHGLSCAILFADLAGAFASVIRRLGIGNDVTDMELARRLRHIGFTGEQICETIDEMKK